MAWKKKHFNPVSENFVVRSYAEWIAYKIKTALVLKYGERPEDVVKFMPRPGSNYSENDITVIPTPHGFHVVTPPFNRDPQAMAAYFGVGMPNTSWIKPDAMTLLYAPETIT
jgi:hypothetical protein